jgi:hypothetical protein
MKIKAFGVYTFIFQYFYLYYMDIELILAKRKRTSMRMGRRECKGECI